MRIFVLVFLVSGNVYAQTSQTTARAYSAVALIHNQAMVAQDFGKVVVLDASSLSLDDSIASDWGHTSKLIFNETMYGGQIVVETSRPGILPDERRKWEVVPKGLLPGTNVPVFRFLGYHDTGKDAEEPKMAGPAPMDDKEPGQPDYSVTRAMIERLDALQEQLEASVIQVSLATCGIHCNPTALRKTKTDLLAFKKGMNELSANLTSDAEALTNQQEWLQRHGRTTYEVVNTEFEIARMQSKVQKKDTIYSDWVENELIHRSAESHVGW